MSIWPKISAALRTPKDLRKVADLSKHGPSRRRLLMDMTRSYSTHGPEFIARSVNRLFGDRTRSVMLHLPNEMRFSYRSGSSDLRVLKQIFVLREYDSGDVPLRNVRTIVDLGSNIGLTAMYWGSNWPQARIICVEPDPENFALLESNTAALGERCQCIEAAAGDHDGEITFYRSKSVYFWSSSTHERMIRGETEAITVPCLTMNALIERADLDSIDLLKIDIEGAEEELLAGIASWPILPRYLVAEIHGAYTADRFRADVEKVVMRVLPPHPRRRMHWAVRPDELDTV